MSPPANAQRQPPPSRVRRLNRRLRKRFGDWWSLRTAETPKAILRRGLKAALQRCWIHLLPVTTVSVVAALNIQGYYVGDQYQGRSTNTWQTFDVLGLQIAAKLLELFIAASLGLTVMDTVQYLLTVHTDGLPIGLIGAKSRVAEIKYFFSIRFLGAIRGLSTKTQRLLITLYLLTVGIILLLAGPSTAVLVLPAIHDTWSAGSATFQMIGRETDLCPTIVDNSLLDSANCLNISAVNLRTPEWSQLSCPWAGYPVLASTYNTFDGLSNSPIGFDEAGVSRQVVQHARALSVSPESWSMASSLAIGFWFPGLRNSWRWAARSVRTTLTQASLKNYVYSNTGLVSAVSAPVPTVRTVCHYDTAVKQATYLLFPLLEPFRTWQGDTLIVEHVNDPPDPRFSPNITTFWLPVPAHPSYISHGNWNSTGNSSDAYSSAMLVINVPMQTSESSILEVTLSCSVDARWAPGLHRSQSYFDADDVLVPMLDPSHLRSSDLPPDTNYTSGPLAFQPKNDGSWKTIALELDWLAALTPHLKGTNSNETTLTTLFEVSNLRNATERAGTQYQRSLDSLCHITEMIISTVVADGLSRISAQYQIDKSSLGIDPSRFVELLSGTRSRPNYKFPPPLNRSNSVTDSEMDNATTDRIWFAEVSGLAYSVDNTARRFALALLLIYVLIATAHTILTFARGVLGGRTSDAWNEYEELIVLAQNSPCRPDNLANTCGGVERMSTWARRARIRAKRGDRVKPAEEQVHLLLGDVKDEATAYEYLHSGQRYGQA